MTTETAATADTTATDGGTPAVVDTAAGTLLAGADTEQQQTTDAGEGDAAADEAAAADGEGDKGEGDTDEKSGAPEQYEAFTLPDGVELTDAGVADLRALAKDLNLSQADAQRVADLGGKLVEAISAQQADLVAQARADWVSQSKADTEFGGDKLTENLAVAKKAMDTFGTPALRQLLNESGLGDHPEIIRAFYKAGKTISEDGVVLGGGVTQDTSPEAKARAFYPNSNMN